LFNLPYFSELEMPAKSSRSDGFIEGNPPSYHRVVEEGGANGVRRAESTMPRGIPYLKSPSGLLKFKLVFLVFLTVIFSSVYLVYKLYPLFYYD